MSEETLRLRIIELEAQVKRLQNSLNQVEEVQEILSFSEELIFDCIKKATPRNPVSIKKIGRDIFKHDDESQIESIRVLISKIRKKFKGIGEIRCVRQRGYYFVLNEGF